MAAKGYAKSEARAAVMPVVVSAVVRPDTLLTVDEAAKACSVSDKTIRRWIHDGHLACLLVGPAKRLRIKRSELERVIYGKV